MQNGSVSDFGYTNNAIGNRTAMSRAGSAFVTPDTISYSYNSRSEVIGAVSNQNSAYNYAYSFDPIGNRLTANLAGTSYNYTTNMLNQYTVVNSNQPRIKKMAAGIFIFPRHSVLYFELKTSEFCCEMKF